MLLLTKTLCLFYAIFLWEDLSKANPDIINNRASQNTQTKPRGMTITVRKADNTTETVEVNMPMIVAAQE